MRKDFVTVGIEERNITKKLRRRRNNGYER